MNPRKKREEEKVLQSYVYRDNGEGFFVSTAYRSTSIDALGGEVWYYETFAWEWDKETKDRGKLVADNSGSKYLKGAREQHMHVVEQLQDTGKFMELTTL